MTMKHPTLGTFVVGCAAIVGLSVLILPLGGLILRAVSGRGPESLLQPVVIAALGLSLFTTAITLLVTLALGLPLAWVLSRWKFPLKRWLIVLVELPIVLPPAVAGLALLVTFGRRGVFGGALGEFGISLPFTTAAVVIAQTFVALPYFTRSAQVGFSGIPREIEDAARVDGASGVALFTRIIMPLSMRSLAVGLSFSWARALGEFGATILFAGSLAGRTQTMPLLVYNILETDLDAALWTSLILIGLALSALILIQALNVTRSDSDPTTML